MHFQKFRLSRPRPSIAFSAAGARRRKDCERGRPSGSGAPGGARWTKAIATLWTVSVACSASLAAVLPIADPLVMDLTAPSSPPSRLHPLATDPLDREILSRLLHGARASLMVALFAPALGMVVGGIAGPSVGYYRGRVVAERAGRYRSNQGGIVSHGHQWG
jgi:ABC-type dipeptide/oligopeptide/nickel transport system permease subunit